MSDWLENEVKRHSQKIEQLEQSDVRRDERARLIGQLWKYLVALFVVGLIMGAIIGDVHLLKEVFGR